jgi:MFS superfamily sulfate permease-like transporter
VRWLIVTVEPVTSVDVTSVDVLEEMDNALRDSGIELGFAEMKDPVKDKLKRFGLFYKMGEQRFFPTVEAVVKQYLAATAVVEGRV